MSTPMHTWETVNDAWYTDSYPTVKRMQVPGGWLYSTPGGDGSADSIVFVPKPTKREREPRQ